MNHDWEKRPGALALSLDADPKVALGQALDPEVSFQQVQGWVIENVHDSRRQPFSDCATRDSRSGFADVGSNRDEVGHAGAWCAKGTSRYTGQPGWLLRWRRGRRIRGGESNARGCLYFPGSDI